MKAAWKAYKLQAQGNALGKTCREKTCCKRKSKYENMCLVMIGDW